MIRRHDTLPINRRIEQALLAALALAEGAGDAQADLTPPPRLAAALRHAVFPGGARVRPQLCLAVALACGDRHPQLADAAAAAIELLHCASLVHDDLPCFDNAGLRRGLPSVHAAFGERLAVLAGDALIVLSFQSLAMAAAPEAGEASVPAAQLAALVALIGLLGRRVGAPSGIVAGQAWECEPFVSLADYHRAKTGALFMACTEAGALAAGADPAPWRALGASLGEAYQVADDIRDAVCSDATLGKPAGRDKLLGRPNAVAERGAGGAIEHFDGLIRRAAAAVPECAGAGMLRAMVRAEAERLVPAEAVRRVALAA